MSKSDGRRKITSICEIDGFDKDVIKLNEIFAYNQKGLLENGEVDGVFNLIKKKPKVYNKITKRGIKDVDDIFQDFK